MNLKFFNFATRFQALQSCREKLIRTFANLTFRWKDVQTCGHVSIDSRRTLEYFKRCKIFLYLKIALGFALNLYFFYYSTLYCLLMSSRFCTIHYVVVSTPSMMIVNTKGKRKVFKGRCQWFLLQFLFSHF